MTEQSQHCRGKKRNNPSHKARKSDYSLGKTSEHGFLLHATSKAIPKGLRTYTSKENTLKPLVENTGVFLSVLVVRKEFLNKNHKC